MTQVGGAPSGARGAVGGDRLVLAARVGYGVNGIVHLLIGWLAVQAALGGGGGSTDQSGALSQIAQQPFGRVLLWVGVLGFTALGLLYLSQAVPSVQRTSERVKSAGKALVYLALAWTTLGFARGSGGSSSEQSSDLTAAILAAPGGVLIVSAIGLVVVGVGIYHVHKGWTKKFLRDLEGSGSGGAVEPLGMVGYVAKGVALTVVGLLFVVAAVQSDPSEATGLDGALGALREQPFGVVLLLLVGLGIAAYGLYSFARARYGHLRTH